MKILVIDGMGGGMGKAIIECLKANLPGHGLYALGTNAVATAAMLKAGANYAATGESAIVYNCRDADFILGPLGIILANAMLGEISPRMAEAVSSSAAYKFLLPIAQCNTMVLGVPEKPIAQYLDEIPGLVRKFSGQ